MIDLILGVDEVGVGSLAGPLVVGAVAYPSSGRPPVLKRMRRADVSVKDSKLINKALLPQFADLIYSSAIHNTCVLKPAWMIDRYGVEEMRREAMCAVVKRTLERLTFLYRDDCKYSVIIDGDFDLHTNAFKYKAVAGADKTIWQVSCASIIAKHAQVQVMTNMHRDHPHYGWDRNAGYGTSQHLAALREHGATKFHRHSYKPVRELRV